MATETERDSAQAQGKLERSATRLATSAENQEESADRRTQLAADRTLLAAERTYAAWVRTGLAALAAGVGAKALLDDLVHPWLVLAASIVLILFSEFCFVAGVWRELRGAAPPPRNGHAASPRLASGPIQRFSDRAEFGCAGRHCPPLTTFSANADCRSQVDPPALRPSVSCPVRSLREECRWLSQLRAARRRREHRDKDAHLPRT